MNLYECPAWKETERVLDKLNIPYRTNQNGFVVSLMKENDININPRKTDDYVRFELKDCLKQCLEFVNCELHFERRYKSNIPGRMEYTPCVDLKNIEKFIVELNNSIDIIKNMEDYNMNNQNEYDKNIILYGPPGTGKTYNTAIYAVAICDGKKINEITDYSEVMKRYKELEREGRIAFTTFHQSYGYEEFIEGIKPVTDSQTGNITYEVVDGTFKSFCDNNSKNIDIRKAFDTAWNRMIETVENSGSRIVFTRKTGSKLEAVYIDDNKFRVEWNGDNHNDLTKSTIFKQWSDMNLTKDSLSGGSRWLYDARLAVIDELSKYGLPKYNEQIRQNCVFIIDEINHGNISKIFGELITLIEDKKREGMPEAISAKLPYSRDEFSVPDNIYIIGTMNTADRSIALMDTALRRRFNFIEMLPDSAVLRDIGSDMVGELDVAKMLDVINERITFLYDREHTIGHAFFSGLKENASVDYLASIFLKEVIPLLQEYFYDDYQKIQFVLGDNGKNDENLKFIKDKPIVANDVFKGNVDELADLPEKMYEINKEAFYNLQSYINIL